MIRAAITGGGGFLGGAILRRCLARGWEVRAVGRAPHPEIDALAGAEFFPLDVSDEKNVPALAEIFAGTDVVFHTAAKAGVWGKYADFERANLAGTRNVVAACRAAGTRNLVHTSTPSVVFSGNAIRGGNESLPYYSGALSAYAKTKAEAEAFVRAAHSPELRTVSLRPHLIWGNGDPHLLPRVVDRASQRKLRVVGDGKNRVDLTHVENAAHAHLLAAEALLADAETLCGEASAPRGNGKVYFVSDGAPVALWDWINDVLAAIGVPAVERSVSFKSAYRAGAFLEFFWKIFGVAGEPPITRFVATELAHDHWFDISAIRRDLGYAPVVSSDEGVRRLTESFRSANPRSVPAEGKKSRVARAVWLAAAFAAAVAAFLFQWKNNLDQAAIAQADSGEIVRAAALAPDGAGDAFPRFRILSGGGKISEALLCDGGGNVVCMLKPGAGTPEIFRCIEIPDTKNFPRERRLRIVVPALRSGGKPLVLLVENPLFAP